MTNYFKPSLQWKKKQNYYYGRLQHKYFNKNEPTYVKRQNLLQENNINILDHKNHLYNSDKHWLLLHKFGSFHTGHKSTSKPYLRPQRCELHTWRVWAQSNDKKQNFQDHYLFITSKDLRKSLQRGTGTQYTFHNPWMKNTTPWLAQYRVK